MTENHAHPVPRIEYVETAHVRVPAPTVGDPEATVPGPPNDQPWHVRYIGGNGEPLATSENLSDRGGCDTNALALARLFGVVEPQVVGDQLRGLVVLGEDGTAKLEQARRVLDVHLERRFEEARARTVDGGVQRGEPAPRSSGRSQASRVVDVDPATADKIRSELADRIVDAIIARYHERPGFTSDLTDLVRQEAGRDA